MGSVDISRSKFNKLLVVKKKVDPYGNRNSEKFALYFSEICRLYIKPDFCNCMWS
jgi:hypothetical protein